MVTMEPFDFFQAGELPAPVVSATDAVAIARDHFGRTVTATALGSQQDANFLLRGVAGDPVGVLKVANPAFGRVEIEAQDAAATFLAGVGLRAARNITPIAEIPDGAGGILFGRIIDFLDGGTLSGDGYVPSHRWAALGALVGRAGAALAGFDHPGLQRTLQWDLRHADRTIELLARYVAEPSRRHLVQTAAADAWRTVAGLAADLPTQAIHGDITDDNVVCASDEGQYPDGIIDFGDLTHSWAVGELAVTVSSVLRHEGGEPVAALPLIAAFDQVRPLLDVEIAALWPLVVLRAATLVVSGNQQAVVDARNAAGNDYAAAALEFEWQIFERAVSVPSDVMTTLIADAVGRPPIVRTPESAPILTGIAADDVALLDFSALSDLVDGGAWIDPECERDAAAQALAAGARAVATRYGQPRLTRSVVLQHDSPATVPTGVDVWLADATTMMAPQDGVIETAQDGEVILAGADGVVVLRGQSLRPAVSAGHAVAAGAALATAGPGRLWLQIRTGELPVPAFVRPEYAPGWLGLTHDPAPLLGRMPEAGADEGAGDLVRRRERALAGVQEQYYRRPPRIERGWREYLCAVDGRSYLDMVNNVAAIGHGHPDLADAVARQWRRLNTNSRFNYGAIADFSQRLAATLPDPLDTVFLVNSGSEAVDLALRLAMATTGRHDVVAVAEAYHGWTYATDAISTSVADNPNALTTRPPWVHTVTSPNSYRGEHRGAAAGKYADEAVARIETLVAEGHSPAAFICEPFYGNAGGIALPDGYLPAVYEAVRAAGGLAIADEVQVGYGRLGRWFWGFQGQQVVPDIVTVAKSMGNGQPLGAVITTRAIADAYRSQGYFFSSAGGSPVSCVVGLTVLDVIEREGLQHNALVVGDHLRARLIELATRHPLIGAVHGCGLYMGVELVRDPVTLEPAVAETAAICERMRELGIIVQPTGDRMNVLKMKPPMCLSIASADFFADTLERVLNTGC